ncbi:hypothetical protein B7463_g12085, partial [Scytalidium lignicola]
MMWRVLGVVTATILLLPGTQADLSSSAPGGSASTGLEPSSIVTASSFQTRFSNSTLHLSTSTISSILNATFSTIHRTTTTVDLSISTTSTTVNGGSNSQTTASGAASSSVPAVSGSTAPSASLANPGSTVSGSDSIIVTPASAGSTVLLSSAIGTATNNTPASAASTTMTSSFPASTTAAGISEPGGSTGISSSADGTTSLNPSSTSAAQSSETDSLPTSTQSGSTSSLLSGIQSSSTESSVVVRKNGGITVSGVLTIPSASVPSTAPTTGTTALAVLQPIATQASQNLDNLVAVAEAAASQVSHALPDADLVAGITNAAKDAFSSLDSVFSWLNDIDISSLPTDGANIVSNTVSSIGGFFHLLSDAVSDLAGAVADPATSASAAAISTFADTMINAKASSTFQDTLGPLLSFLASQESDPSPSESGSKQTASSTAASTTSAETSSISTTSTTTSSASPTATGEAQYFVVAKKGVSASTFQEFSDTFPSDPDNKLINSRFAIARVLNLNSTQLEEVKGDPRVGFVQENIIPDDPNFGVVRRGSSVRTTAPGVKLEKPTKRALPNKNSVDTNDLAPATNLVFRNRRQGSEKLGHLRLLSGTWFDNSQPPYNGQDYLFEAQPGKDIWIYVADSAIRSTHAEFADVKQEEIVISKPDTKHGTSVASFAVGKNVGVASSANLVSVAFDILKLDEMLLAMTSIFDDVVQKGRQGKAVVNMSWGIFISSDSRVEDIEDFWLAICLRDLIEIGVVPVCAPGNNGEETNSPEVLAAVPGAYAGKIDGLIVVGSVDSNGKRSPFTPKCDALDSTSTCLTAWANGQGASGAVDTSDTAYDAVDGTSFASPIIAGLSAYLMGSVNQRIRDLVYSNGTSGIASQVSLIIQTWSWSRNPNGGVEFPNVAYNGAIANSCNLLKFANEPSQPSETSEPSKRHIFSPNMGSESRSGSIVRRDVFSGDDVALSLVGTKLRDWVIKHNLTVQLCHIDSPELIFNFCNLRPPIGLFNGYSISDKHGFDYYGLSQQYDDYEPSNDFITGNKATSTQSVFSTESASSSETTPNSESDTSTAGSTSVTRGASSTSKVTSTQKPTPTLNCQQNIPSGGPDPASIEQELAGNFTVSTVCKVQFQANPLEDAVGINNMVVSITRPSADKPLQHCLDAMQSILTTCILGSSDYGGVFELDGEIYNVSNSVFPNDPGSIEARPPPPPTVTPLPGGTNLHVASGGGCISIFNIARCENDPPYNINEQISPNSNALLLAKFDPNNHDIGSVQSGCESNILFPANYGDIYFQADDNCFHDSQGNKIDTACCTDDSISAFNPYYERSATCGPAALQKRDDNGGLTPFELLPTYVHLTDSVVDVEHLLQAMAVGLCADVSKCTAPTNFPGGSFSTSTDNDQCTMAVALPNDLVAIVTISDLSLDTDTCVNSLDVVMAQCLMPQAGNSTIHVGFKDAVSALISVKSDTNDLPTLTPLEQEAHL